MYLIAHFIAQHVICIHLHYFLRQLSVCEVQYVTIAMTPHSYNWPRCICTKKILVQPLKFISKQWSEYIEFEIWTNIIFKVSCITISFKKKIYLYICLLDTLLKILIWWRHLDCFSFKYATLTITIKRNHFEVIMCVCFSHDTKHVHFEVISFYNGNMSLIIYYVVCVICISKKLKYLKTEARESKTER